MQGINGVINKVYSIAKNEGVYGYTKRVKQKVSNYVRKNKSCKTIYKDVLFISGCNDDLPHPFRYRVLHQREQLEACNFSTDVVYFQDLHLQQVLYYRAFIIFRCPITEQLEKFVDLAKSFNKKIIYDVDDLVIDTKYTDLIEYVRNMPSQDKANYDKNVLDMQRMLKKCDAAITSTNCLCEELSKYISPVFLNRNTVSEEMLFLSNEALKNVEKSEKVIKIGYFSGSITHNEDFKIICPALIDVFDKYQHIELHLAGLIELPSELIKYKNRIKMHSFVDWKKLPLLLAKMDINLAPLTDTIFNRAKSENKWVEASLVKVVTVASNVGAFRDCIENGVTGILCNDIEEWKTSLEKLVVDKEMRCRIGENAYRHCKESCTTINCALNLMNIMKTILNENIVFVLPGLEISGGVRVVLKHSGILQRAGKEVVLLVLDGEDQIYCFEGQNFPVISIIKNNIIAQIDQMVATMWTTQKYVENYPVALYRKYLVQNFERDFYCEGNPFRIEANKSYIPVTNFKFITISKWCQEWLKERYNQNSLYAPNGIDIGMFISHKRNMNTKVRILIEGDCAVEYKNIDEAFRITNDLNREKYEIWYMSYNAKPKKWYRYDRFLHKVSYDMVPQIYEKCDILLKTSLLESFSYPPLEMMATGGYVLVIPNEGNVEYLIDGENCVFYERGNVEQAHNLIKELVENPQLQERLYQNGIKTARKRAWKNVESEILSLYR